MKGTFFQKQIEFTIELHGENWSQGEQITGKLNIRNHATSAIELSNTGCHLCLGTTKKIKEKQDKAFELIESVGITNLSLESNEEKEISFKFDLQENCLISESSKSLYIVCGDIKMPYDIGALALAILPNKTILNFVEVFESFYKFKFKPFKNKKEFIEAKVTPPSSKEWTSIQAMALKLKLKDGNLYLNFNFKLKKMAYDASSVSTKDSVLEVPKELSKKQHTSFGTSPNQEGIKKVIEEVLGSVKITPMI